MSIEQSSQIWLDTSQCIIVIDEWNLAQIDDTHVISRFGGLDLFSMTEQTLTLQVQTKSFELSEKLNKFSFLFLLSGNSIISS